MSATGFSLQVSAKGLVKENLSVSRLASQSTVCCLGKWSWKLSENFPQLWVTNSEPDFWWIIFVYFDYKILVSVSLLDMWKQTPPPKTRSHIHERPILVHQNTSSFLNICILSQNSYTLWRHHSLYFNVLMWTDGPTVVKFSGHLDKCCYCWWFCLGHCNRNKRDSQKMTAASIILSTSLLYHFSTGRQMFGWVFV